MSIRERYTTTIGINTYINLIFLLLFDLITTICLIKHMDNYLDEIIESMDKSKDQLSFMYNFNFFDLINKRATINGNTDINEIKSLLCASIINYCENPVGSFENGRLFFGSEMNALDTNELNRSGINIILNVAGNHSCEFYKDNKSITYKSFQIDDEPDTILPIDDVFNFIQDKLMINKTNKILVHCIEGKSRSGSLIIAYFIKKNNWSYIDAYNFVKTKRVPVPNEGFKKQLVNLTI
jgi:hypothetical protein